MWLYKVWAKPITETYQTKEGTSVIRQTGEVEWTAIKRTHDGQYQAIADEDENGFTAAKGATFLGTVYEPTFPPGAGGSYKRNPPCGFMRRATQILRSLKAPLSLTFLCWERIHQQFEK